LSNGSAALRIAKTSFKKQTNEKHMVKAAPYEKKKGAE
jgi:hypothetical protein